MTPSDALKSQCIIWSEESSLNTLSFLLYNSSQHEGSKALAGAWNIRKKWREWSMLCDAGKLVGGGGGVGADILLNMLYYFYFITNCEMRIKYELQAAE